jgi:Tol biopolymer transport system component
MSATDGSGKKNLTHNPARDYSPFFSPDGNMVAFSRYDHEQGAGAIWKMRADGSRKTKVSGDYGDVVYSSPDWQPLP